MRYIVLQILLMPLALFAQQPDTLRIDALIREALMNNPELEAAELGRDAADARVGQAGVLANPELTYMREEMPGFSWNESMMQKLELMQTIRFPSKLSVENEIAELQSEHAHHDQMEVANAVFAKLRSTYAELWYAQQAQAVNRENTRLLDLFIKTAQTRYAVGKSPQQDVLKAYVERAKLDNELLTLRQQELSSRAMLRALLNRPSSDTLGIAVLDEIRTPLSADSLESLALRFRGMLLHDSLSVIEGNAREVLASREFIPDLKVGLTYVTIPGADFRGWSVGAGVTLPFAPWSMGKTSAMKEEATIVSRQAQATFSASRNMIISSLRDLYYQSDAMRGQLVNYGNQILPQARQSLQASMTAYQTGTTDFLMLIDTYRMLVMFSMEELMLRMKLEQVQAEMIRTVGYSGIFEKHSERN